MTDGTFRVNTVMIASAAAILAIMGSVFSFWMSREKSLWEVRSDTDAVEMAVNDVRLDVDALRARVKSNEESSIDERKHVLDAITEVNKRLEINVTRILRMEGIVDRIDPQMEHPPMNGIPSKTPNQYR